MGEQLEMQAYHIQEFLYNSVQPLRDETEEKEEETVRKQSISKL